jgi:hypothetical protein
MLDYRRYFVPGGTYFFTVVHFNPVKHGLAERPADWPWSSFHRWVRAGHYSGDWAAGGMTTAIRDAGE